MANKTHKFDKNKWAHRHLWVAPHFTNPQIGADVRQLQIAINQRAKARNLGSIKVDGAAGRATIAKGRLVLRSLGIGHKKGVAGLTVYHQHLIRHPSLRTPAQRRRGKEFMRKREAAKGVRIDGNTATGGTPRARLVGAAEASAHAYANGKRPSFYSQAGSWDVSHGITGEHHGMRSDCSQWYTAMCHSAGLPDPNGTGYTGGYTGTLGSVGTYIDRMDLEPGDKILYGPAPHHHIEEWVGNGDGKTSYRELARINHPERDRTIGHGSPPVDEGDIDMIADPHFSRAVL